MAHKSYSIEAEDLVLKRLFEAVVFKGPLRSGRYLDIGAYRPVVHSNTHLFYELGWRGINVEPNPDHMPEFAEFRPEDLTLNMGIHVQSGSLAYHRFNDGLLNGFFGSDIIAHHVNRGCLYLGAQKITCLGIAEFLKEYADEPIDLLNIDIEAVDETVLGAWDWDICRPNVICAEIHTRTLDDLLETGICRILKSAGYFAMSRVFQSAMFVHSTKMN